MRPVTMPIYGGVTLVDADIFRELSDLSWHVDSSGYVRRNLPRDGGKKPTERLHRRITGALPGQVVDHIDGDPLNNTRANLRVTTHRGNSRNTLRTRRTKRGGFKGVYLVKKSGKWAAHIGAGPVNEHGKAKNIHLGCFKFELGAVRAYDRAALFFFGDHAALNFPECSELRLLELDGGGAKWLLDLVAERYGVDESLAAAAHKFGLLPKEAA